VRTVPGRTGTALITVDAAGENTIVVVPGANHSRRWEDLPAGPLPPARSLLLQAELPVPVLDRFVRAAGDRLTVLNLAPYTPLPPGLLQLVDVLVVNEHEAAALLQEPAPRSPDQAADVAARLRGLGPGVVVVTLGAQGAVAADGRTVVCEAALPVPVVDTVGAGDSFVAALTLVLGRGGPLVAAVRAGVAAAALTVQHPGAQPPPPAPPPVPPRDQPTSAA
jgi:ribokinase